MSTKRRAVARITAVEYIGRTHGGSQAKLVRCSDSAYYVTKFRNNPQGPEILANELLGTLIAREIGLPVPEPAIVDVHPQLVRDTEELVIEYRHRSVPCDSGLCFGSLYGNGQASPHGVTDAYGLIRSDKLSTVENPSEFLGMLVFDKWVGNVD